MTDLEIMKALIAGRVLKNQHGLYLRINPETGNLESRAIPMDPDWTSRDFFSEAPDTVTDAIVRKEWRYTTIVNAATYQASQD